MILRLSNAMRFSALLAAVVLVLGGSAHADDRDKLGLGHLDIESPDIAATPGGAATATIMAAEGRWQSTGALLRRGNTYRITASGQWQQGFLCSSSGPSGEGSGCFPPLPVAALKGLPIGTLIGKVGKEGTPFPVGAEREFTAQADGVLYLRDNDIADFSFDNTGFVNVKVSVVAAAAPAPPVAAPAPPIAAPAPPTAARPATPEPAPVSAAPMPSTTAQYWAVIIGVSEYAAKDARAIHDWLVSPQGGRYAPARVKLLVDRDATGNNIREALFGWLRQAIEEDVVMIFFAGHGSPDAPDTPGNLYLLPTDARYDAIASSGFPMWDIETALKRFVKAKRVVVVADACHSGGVGESFDIARRSTSATPSNPISSGLHSLAAIGPGVAVLSASDDKQFSAEGPMFGGGHGVFTHFLLEGLKGKADYNQDQRVTLGELIPYLSENVRRATRNTQSPTVAGRFDPALAIGR